MFAVNEAVLEHHRIAARRSHSKHVPCWLHTHAGRVTRYEHKQRFVRVRRLLRMRRDVIDIGCVRHCSELFASVCRKATLDPASLCRAGGGPWNKPYGAELGNYRGEQLARANNHVCYFPFSRWRNVLSRKEKNRYRDCMHIERDSGGWATLGKFFRNYHIVRITTTNSAKFFRHKETIKTGFFQCRVVFDGR